MMISRSKRFNGFGQTLKTYLTCCAIRLLFSIQLSMTMTRTVNSATAQIYHHPMHLELKSHEDGSMHGDSEGLNPKILMSKSKIQPQPMVLPDVSPNVWLSRSRELGYDLASEDEERNSRLLQLPEIDPIAFHEDDDDTEPEALPVSKLTRRQLVELLLDKIKTKTHHDHESRNLQLGDSSSDSDIDTDKDITHMCAQHASLTCGKDVLENVEDRGDTNDKCNMRKNFLDCITDTREECNEMAKVRVFPRLPPKSQIADFQKRVWRALWTSGGCVLAN